MASTMDTLVSLGTLSAYLWSLVVLVTGVGMAAVTAAGTCTSRWRLR